MKKFGLNICFTRTPALRHLLSNKQPFSPQEQHKVVYAINCQQQPQHIYIGQTKRQVHTRISEHSSNLKNKTYDKSTLVAHCMETGHTPDWQSTSVLHKQPHLHQRLIAESLLQQAAGQDDISDQSFYTHDAWRPLYPCLRTLFKKQQQQTSPQLPTPSAPTPPIPSHSIPSHYNPTHTYNTRLRTRYLTTTTPTTNKTPSSNTQQQQQHLTPGTNIQQPTTSSTQQPTMATTSSTTQTTPLVMLCRRRPIGLVSKIPSPPKH